MLPLSRLLAALLLPALCSATVTVMETGQSFPSRPDHLIGAEFLVGFEYMARLQVFEKDLNLCPSADDGKPVNLTLTVPPDGMPVAILAKHGGGCSIETKARLASFSVHPPHLLKYLIIYGVDEFKRERIVIPSAVQQQQEQPRLLRLPDRHNRRHDNDDVTVGILYVSEESGNELLRTILNQSTDSKEHGGPRLLLDGRDAHHSWARDLTLWMGIAIMMMACIFSFLLSIRAQQAGIVNQTQAAAVRPTRRRLTVQQVDDLLQEEEYDARNHSEEEHVCSICLDEFASREKCRCLPCGHLFHSKCISKWLSERSSTCPLCKTDLLGEEESDDESSRVSEQPVFTRMDQFMTSIRERLQRGRQQDREQQMVLHEEEGGVSREPLLQRDELDQESGEPPLLQNDEEPQEG